MTTHYCPCGNVAVAKASGGFVCESCLKVESSKTWRKAMAGLATPRCKGAGKVETIDWDNYHGTTHIAVGGSLVMLEERLRAVA